MSHESAQTAGRAIGSMFFSIFGAAWLVGWCTQAYGMNVAILSIILAVALAIFSVSFRQYKRNRHAYVAEADSLGRRRIKRIFNIVNTIQWVLVFVVIFALSYIGHSEWEGPVIILIVGSHFFPLASAFKNHRHYITGTALVVLAGIYPFVSKEGPASPIGYLGTGLILWVSAAWAMMLDGWASIFRSGKNAAYNGLS
jgi:hypothetical protein